MNKDSYNIADSEWLVMKVLWKKAPLTSTQIIEALSSETSWKPKTIHSLIDRLVKKDILGVDKRCTPYEFYPLINEDDCAMEETKSFLQKVYNGSLQLMLSNFIKNEKISEKEIDELQKFLDKSINSNHQEDK